MPAFDPFISAAAVAATAGTAILARATFHPNSSMYCRTIARIPTPRSDCLALTFDDGPWPGSTEPILEALGRSSMRATFFVIGAYGLAYPSLLRRIHDEGHALANHTLHHSRLGLFHAKQYWLDQIRRTDEIIASATGSAPRFFRAPMGFKSPPMAAAIGVLGHTVVGWTRRARDGVTTTPERIRANLSGVTAGEIVLLHDGRDPASRRDLRPTAVALPAILDELTSRGVRSERLDVLLTHPANAPDASMAR